MMQTTAELGVLVLESPTVAVCCCRCRAAAAAEDAARRAEAEEVEAVLKAVERCRQVLP